MEDRISSSGSLRGGRSNHEADLWWIRGGSRVTWIVMVVALLGGAALMAIGLTAFSSACFIVAFVCALVVVFDSVRGRNHR